ncbi:MAG: hypothetical protein ACREXY_06170 [Gammaproteobacteria bacterium]
MLLEFASWLNLVTARQKIDFKIAVNARIARHLGIFGGHEDLSRFDLVLDPTGGIE